jgi:hypothetical protein
VLMARSASLKRIAEGGGKDARWHGDQANSGPWKKTGRSTR